jgi:hypothetical protein
MNEPGSRPRQIAAATGSSAPDTSSLSEAETQLPDAGLAEPIAEEWLICLDWIYS